MIKNLLQSKEIIKKNSYFFFLKISIPLCILCRIYISYCFLYSIIFYQNIHSKHFTIPWTVLHTANPAPGLAISWWSNKQNLYIRRGEDWFGSWQHWGAWKLGPLMVTQPSNKNVIDLSISCKSFKRYVKLPMDALALRLLHPTNFR